MTKTKQEYLDLLQYVSDMFEAIPKSKRGNFLGELNELSIYFERRARLAEKGSK